MNIPRILLYFLLMAAVGVAIGIFIVYFKRRTVNKFKGHNMDKLKKIETRWNAMYDDLKLVRNIGVDLGDKFVNATPDKIEELNNLSRKFESAWFRQKNNEDVSPGTNMMETVTSYELERLLSKIEVKLTNIFDEK